MTRGYLGGTLVCLALCITTGLAGLAILAFGAALAAVTLFGIALDHTPDGPAALLDNDHRDGREQSPGRCG